MNYSNDYDLMYQSAEAAFTVNDFDTALKALVSLRWNDDFPAECIYDASIFREKILKRALQYHQQTLIHAAEERSTVSSHVLALKKILNIPANSLRQELIKKVRSIEEQLIEERMMQNFYEGKVHPERYPLGIFDWHELPIIDSQFSLTHPSSSLEQNRLYSRDTLTPVQQYTSPSSSLLDVGDESQTPLVTASNSKMESLAITPLPVLDEVPAMDEGVQVSRDMAISVLSSRLSRAAVAALLQKAKQHELLFEWDVAQEIYSSILQQDHTDWRCHKALIDLIIKKNGSVEERLAVCKAFITVYKESLQFVQSKNNKMCQYYVSVLASAAVLSCRITGNEEQSILWLEEALPFAPQDRDLHHFLAAAYKNKLLKNPPQYCFVNDACEERHAIPTLLNQITEERRAGMKKALFHYNKARELGCVWDKNTYDLVLKLSTLSGDFDQAIRCCDDYLKNKKNEPGLILYVEYKKALFYMEKHHYPESLRIMERLLGQPNFNMDFPEARKSELYFDLARAQEQLGYYSNAMHWFSRAIIEDSTNIMYYLAVQRLQTQRKDLYKMISSCFEEKKQLAAQKYFTSLGMGGIEIIFGEINLHPGLKEKNAYFLCLAGGLLAKELKKPEEALCYFQQAQGLRPLNELESNTYKQIQMVLGYVRQLKASQASAAVEDVAPSESIFSCK
ncbi:MAG: hypothetical protein CK426_01890 [Legionella sp.]|nr:MAG: hypothetical protein CK423_00220 [Legionella sp.]PJD99557.1 MAG: hypothetical protein CK426_01890 [Legionella sp.]